MMEKYTDTLKQFISKHKKRLIAICVMKKVVLLALLVFMSAKAYCIDDLTAAMRTSRSGIEAQNIRMKLIAQNIANSDSTPLEPGKEPYRRKMLFLKNRFNNDLKAEVVEIRRIAKDKTPFTKKYLPYHPAADKNGYVLHPNVDITKENVDAMEVQRTLEANLSALDISKHNQMKLMEAMR